MDNKDRHDHVNRPDQPQNPNAPKLRPYQLPASVVRARDEKEAAERRERIAELRRDAEHPERKHRVLKAFARFFGWILLIAVLTVGGGYAGWYFLLKPNTPSAPKTTQAQSAAPTPEPATTKNYQSTNFGLAFNYPQEWIVTDNSLKLTVVSPAMQLKTATGTKQNGQITMTIQNRQSTIPAFKSGNAVAVIESQKITYAKPSQTQRADSYISFLNYASSTADGLDGVYVSGDNGYQVGQAVPQVDLAKADPLITFTFTACSDAKCTTTGKPLTLATSVWSDAAVSKPIKDMLQSIVVQ